MSAAEENRGPTNGGTDEGEESKGSLGRWIAISLAAIVVLGAAIAIIQTDAGVNESNTARETTRTAVGALRAGVVENAAELLEEDIDAESSALVREQAFVARQSGEAAEPLTSAELETLIPEGSDLPGARTREELLELSFDSERLALRQAALAETRVTWNDRATQYTTAIAMLAVALFLVGFSLVLRGPQRVVFYLFGLGVALLVVGVTFYIYLLPIPETPEDAITATARGTVESQEGEQERAIELFDDAIEVEGDYPDPYSRRAVARAVAANPDVRETGAVTGGDAALEESIADSLRAVELDGSRDFLTFAFIAIAGVYAGDYEEAVRAADEGIAINSRVPDIRFAKSAAEVGLGDADAANEALEGALEQLSGSDPSERTRALVADYLTYLEQVVQRVPERTELVGRIEARIIALETAFSLDREVSGEPPDRGSVVVEGLRYEDGRIRIRTRWDDLPAGTALTLIGFERPARDSGWVQPRELALFRTVGGSGEEVGRVPIQRTCTPVELRVDAYLDGAFVESFTGPGGAETC